MGPSIARVITWLPVGGIERRLVTVLPRLKRRGWNPTLYCVRERGPLAQELEQAGVPVIVVPFRSRLSPVGLRRLSAQFRARSTELVHSHMYRSNVPATIAARMAGTKAIFAQIHNVDTWETPRQRSLDRWLCRWRTGIIAVSGSVQRDVVQNLRLSESRVPVLYNGIDTERFRPDAEKRASTRAALGLEPTETAVLVPARLHPQKNPFGMLAAWQEALPAAPGRATLLFAGDGGERERLAADIEDRKLGGSVRLLGSRDDMDALYNAADAIALPSFKEGFSNAIVEALACGKPVLATDVGGNAEAISSPAVGWIVPSGDVSALAQALADLLRRGPALEEFAEPCRRRGLVFSIDAMIDETHRLYVSALGYEP